MRHPDLGLISRRPDTVKERAVVDPDIQGRTAEFLVIGIFNLAAEQVTHQLLAVTDAQYRDPQLEHQRINRRCALGHDTGGATGQDNGLGLINVEERFIDAETGMDFAVDPGLANASRDQLGDLRTEVDDENFFRDGRRCGHRF
jgi:hypothetical protein